MEKYQVDETGAVVKVNSIPVDIDGIIKHIAVLNDEIVLLNQQLTDISVLPNLSPEISDKIQTAKLANKKTV